MTTLSILTPRESATASPRVPLQPLRAITRTLADWRARNELRTQLRSMPDYLLRDVGLDADDVREETRKPFWRP